MDLADIFTKMAKSTGRNNFWFSFYFSPQNLGIFRLRKI